MGEKEILPVIGYNIDFTEFDVNKLKDQINVNGRIVTAQRMTVVAPNIHTGEQERTEYVVPTAWCYRQVKEHHIHAQQMAAAAQPKKKVIRKRKPPETVVPTMVTEEVTGDADEGGDVVRRSDGRPESPSAGEQR